MNKRCFALLIAMMVAVSPNMQALQIWLRLPSGKTVKNDKYSTLEQLTLQAHVDYLKAVVKLVVEKNDLPFDMAIKSDIDFAKEAERLAEAKLRVGAASPFQKLYGNPPTPGKSRYTLGSGINYKTIEKCTNLEQLLFEEVEFRKSQLRVDDDLIHSPYSQYMSETESPYKVYEPNPNLDWIFKLRKLRLVYFVRCPGAEDICKVPSPAPGNLKRVVNISDGAGKTNLYTDLRPCGTWDKFLHWPGINWIAKRLAGIFRNTKTFYADPENPEFPPSKGKIPTGTWKVSFVGYEGLYKKSEGITKENTILDWHAFFRRQNVLDIKHLTIDGGTLYWVRLWKRFSNARTIMLRNLKPLPDESSITRRLDWDNVEFPPMLENIQIEGGTMRQDEIEELKKHLPKEVEVTEVAHPGSTSPPTQ